LSPSLPPLPSSPTSRSPSAISSWGCRLRGPLHARKRRFPALFHFLRIQFLRHSKSIGISSSESSGMTQLRLPDSLQKIKGRLCYGFGYLDLA
jgi:hypothetical protein